MGSSVIIVAGGRGTRLDSQTPKQFLELSGKPLLQWVLEKFQKAAPEAERLVVLAEDLIPQWEELCGKAQEVPEHRIVKGGNTRFHSTFNGLKAGRTKGVVAVHDAARPMISTSLIKRIMDEAEESGSALPVVPVSGSLRMLWDRGSRAVDRRYYRLVQTPQAFHRDLLWEAFQQPYDSRFTDEGAVVEAYGHEPSLVEGEEENIKVTTEKDLARVRSIKGTE